MQHSSSRGFTILELSIILVVLGLLTGSIMLAQSFVRASELRAVSAEYQRYSTSINAFFGKYGGLPGDLPDATQYWGVNGNTTTCRSNVSTTQLTCDGNGDGLIDTVDASVTMHERFSAWKHLANAGMVEGDFTGVGGPDGARDFAMGVNSPPSKFARAGWMFAYRHPAGVDVNWFATQGGNFLQFGGETGTVANWGPVLTPEEAWKVDDKVDDGRPGTGQVISLNGTNTLTPGCTTGTTSSASYLVTTESPACILVFFFGH